MTPLRKPWIRWFKLLLTVLILTLIARRFAIDLQNPALYRDPIHPGWLLSCGILYLSGLGCCCWFWGWLIGRFTPVTSPFHIVRAYYLGQMGKYIPGKAMALILRGALGSLAGCSAYLASLTAFFEVLTTMAAGSLLAGCYFFYCWLIGDSSENHAEWTQVWSALRDMSPPENGFSNRSLALASLALSSLLLTLVWPPLFNRLANRLTMPFRSPGQNSPTIRFSDLMIGLLAGLACWILFGWSLFCAARAIGMETDLPLGYLTASLGISYVAGFLVLLAPGGLGIRELFLTWLLTPRLAALYDEASGDMAQGKIVLLVLVLRLTWTTAELMIAAGFYFWRGRNP